MIDTNKYKKIYVKMQEVQLKENHGLVVGQISKLSGVDANTVVAVAKELGFEDLSNISQEQYAQICNAVKDTQKLITPTTPKKEPIKDAKDLDSLNEADKEENQDDEATENSEELPMDLLYDIIYAYYLASNQNPNPKAQEFITKLNSMPMMKTFASKYSVVTTKSEMAKTQDEKRNNPTALKTMMTNLFSAIAKDAREKKKENNP